MRDLYRATRSTGKVGSSRLVRSCLFKNEQATHLVDLAGLFSLHFTYTKQIYHRYRTEYIHFVQNSLHRRYSNHSFITASTQHP